MSDVEELRRRIAALGVEVAEAEAARQLAGERAAEAEAALRASYELLARVGDPLFAATFEEARLPEIARLRRRIKRLKARNERLRRDLQRLQDSRSVRWTTAATRVARRLRRSPRA